MKKLFITACVASLAIASTADAWGQERNNNSNRNNNVNENVSNTHNQNFNGANSNSQSTAHSGSAAGASSNVNVSNSGTYEEAAYAPGVVVGDCQWGVSAGVPGAVAGIGIPGKHCRVLQEAELIEYYWGKNAAGQHLYSNNKRIRETVDAVQKPQAVRTSTRSRVTVASVSATPARGEDR